ncbi:tRNA epoxyqueuosine(34) reductase QueG [Priestia taiwanensis]|uniref:Epoxyqueuosine reductase n=1 Tax=Priestia taiwanensis TaxID=1347902 RepID=A0A917EQM8_9BACI|nr:tRNA epoxyqueuosine(34) reductase QueG [Priestia taiwanensis]MBM7365208.1 epoxyqueuosine reductase [Priestia taiwanensis]GGE73668.1 epoxyqueuosine reductase [Priestia taiwanensis]
MDIYALQQDIIRYSKEIGIDKIGFTTADPFSELKARLVRQQELGYNSGFEEPDLDKRTDATLLLPGATSIISIALAYPSKLEDAPKGKKGERRGLFCRSSWGLDYHRVLKDRLTKLEAYILEIVPNATVQSMVDTGALSDRAVAERAGIGWSGKNCAIITPEFGSYVYLGEMITNIPFIPDTPMEDQCGTCTKCLDACPTDALVGPGQIDAKRCISFLTQTKDFIPMEFRKKIGNRIYGCDSCQTSCPVNKGHNHQIHKEMEPDAEIAKAELIPMLQLSNREFKAKFGHVSGAWRGKNPLQRNAIIALAHFKEEAAIPTLVELVKKDTRPVIRGTAAWALGEIGNVDMLSVLYEALEKEEEQEVRNEIEYAIDVLKNIE